MIPTSANLAIWAIVDAATAGVIARPFKMPEPVWAILGALALLVLAVPPWADAWRAIGKGGRRLPVAHRHDAAVRDGAARRPIRLGRRRRRETLEPIAQAQIVDNKRLGPALEWCRAEQAKLEPESRSRKAPARRDQQSGRIFSAG